MSGGEPATLPPTTPPTERQRRAAVLNIAMFADRYPAAEVRTVLEALGLLDDAEALRSPSAPFSRPNHTTTRANAHRQPERPYSASTDPTQTTSTTEERP